MGSSKKKRCRNTAKSNRAQGDYTEIGVALGLMAHYRAAGDSSLADTQQDLARKVLDTHTVDGPARLERQDRNIDASVAAAVKVIDANTDRFGEVQHVCWTGRQRSHGVADVVVVHVAGETRLSIKSTRTGSGTSRNHGLKWVLNATGVDARGLSRTIKDTFLSRVRDEHGDARARQLAKGGGLRHRVTEEEAALAEEVANPALSTLTRSLYDALRAADQGTLRKIVADCAAVTLASENDGARAASVEIVANDSGVVVTDLQGTVAEGEVTVESNSDKGLILLVGGEPYVRLQINCTNRIGLSSPCIRAFRRHHETV